MLGSLNKPNKVNKATADMRSRTQSGGGGRVVELAMIKESTVSQHNDNGSGHGVEWHSQGND